MSFQTRNTYYLRISEKIVLPLHIYLDERHLDWMSDVILQHVLADIRPHIVAKLQTEAGLLEAGTSSKKSTLDTHRGETYQFCYFFRKAEPHSVVIKSRNFVAVSSPKRPGLPPPPQPSKPRRRKRKSDFRHSTHLGDVTRKKRKTRSREQNLDSDELSTSTDGESLLPSNPRGLSRSTRSKKTSTDSSQKLAARGQPTLGTAGDAEEQAIIVDEVIDQVVDDTEFMPVSDPSNNMETDVLLEQEEPLHSVDLELNEEEEKPKPLLQLKYQGFSILGSCLCVVVEPWPPLQHASRVRFNTSALTKQPSSTSRNISSVNRSIREKTPLFLPDDYADEHEHPAAQRRRNMDSLTLLDPNFLEDSDDSVDEDGMILFSQVLKNTGGIPAGAAEDDEEMDTDIFFGDADEIRELR